MKEVEDHKGKIMFALWTECELGEILTEMAIKEMWTFVCQMNIDGNVISKDC